MTTDRTIDELVADPTVVEALRRIGSRPQRCPRCGHGTVNANNRHGWCQPCETEHDERIRASKRRSYHRRKRLPNLTETDRTKLNDAAGKVIVGEEGWRFLTVDETARILNVTPRAVQNWIKDGTIRSVKIGGRTRRIPADAIVDLLDQEGQRDG